MELVFYGIIVGNFLIKAMGRIMSPREARFAVVAESVATANLFVLVGTYTDSERFRSAIEEVDRSVYWVEASYDLTDPRDLAAFLCYTFTPVSDLHPEERDDLRRALAV